MVLDASGSYITPGLIDAHSHLLISEEGMGSIGDDCCDYSDALTPHLEVLDGMYPFDRAVERSAKAGVTSVLVCPGRHGGMDAQPADRRRDRRRVLGGQAQGHGGR